LLKGTNVNDVNVSLFRRNLFIVVEKYYLRMMNDNLSNFYIKDETLIESNF
jgi:hypothetical protein